MASAVPAVEPAASRSFLDRHCVSCHDRDRPEAGLDLENLADAGAAPGSDHVWEMLFDRVTRGEMPSADAEQPTADEKTAFLGQLEAGLREAGLERQSLEGRGPVRRLTRTEYENTLNDLLAIKVSVRDLFPDDAATAGFDKVGAGLTLSASHFEAYQAAADKALKEAMAMIPFTPLAYALDGPGVYKTSEFFNVRGGLLENDVFVVASRLDYPYAAIMSPWVPRGGRYQVRVTAQGRNNGGKPLPVGFGVHSHWLYKPDAPELREWSDVPEDAPRTVTAELDLLAEQQAHVFGPTLWHRDHVTPKHLEGKAWDKATLLISKFEVEGPLKPDGTLEQWPPESYRVLFGDLPFDNLSKVTGEQPAPGEHDPKVPVSASPKEDAERLLRRFLPKAFRRPVAEPLVAEYVNRAHAALDQGVPFHRVMRDAYKAILCSPHFLLLEEAPGPLDPHAIASRMSYFLWNGPPDEPLRAAADRGDLGRPDVRRAEVERMLADPRAVRFERSFTDQWLDLQQIDATAPDGGLYPEFDDALRLSCMQETQRFFHELLAHDRSLLEGIHSDWTYLNEPLAALYGLPDMPGHELRKATLPPGSRRGGFLTQASVLKVTADGAKTSPILRGKWVTERILGVVPPAPPDSVPKIEPDIRGAATIREQLAKHRSTQACAGCHRLIDPPGFALESFDVIGGWRERYRVPQATGAILEIARINRQVNLGAAVEHGYTMPDGRPFADVDEYKHHLLENPDGLAAALASKLIVYATGADVQFADRKDLDEIVARIRGKGYGLRSLVHEVVESRPFLQK